MGNVTISTSEILAVIGGAVGLVTAIWYAALYVGKLTVKVDRHEDRINDHEERLDDHGNQLHERRRAPR